MSLRPDHTANDLRALMERFNSAAHPVSPAEQANQIKQQLAESAPDVMRHKGDTTIRVVKRAGKPIGEIGTDSEASPGNGQYYVKLYDGSYDAVGFDSAEEALAELKSAIKQMSKGVAEGSANANETPRSQIIKLYKKGLEDYDIAYDLDIDEKTVADIIDDYDKKQQQQYFKKNGVTEAAGLYGPFTVTINTGERPQSRTKTKRFKREDDAVLWAEDWLENFPQYSLATAKVTDPAGNVVWTTNESEGVAEAKPAARKRPLPKFTAYPNYAAWRQELMRRGDDQIDHLDNDYVDNYRVLFAVDRNRRVVGMYYHTADSGSFVPAGQGFSDMIYYASSDPNWPYDGDDGQEDLPEGRAGVDDTDTVGFSVNSEAAYNAVMRRFGNSIDHDETSGVMSAPARLWPQIEMTAFDADPDSGATRVEDDMLDEAEYGGINIDMEKDGDEITVRASAGGKQMGHVLFVDSGEYLMPQDLEVDERFRGQGIAAIMYDYVKSQGYKIRRSGQQTDDGAAFWDKNRPGQNVWEQGVAEGLPQTLRKVVPGYAKRETAEKQYNVSAWRTDQTGTPDVEEFSIGGKTQAKSLAQELKADGFAVIKIHPAGSHYKDGQLIKGVAEARVEINQDAPDNLYDIQDNLAMSRWKSSIKNVITSLFAKRYPGVQLFFKNTQEGNLFVTTDKTALASEDVGLYSDTNEFGASIIGPTAEYGVDDILYVGIGFDSIKSGKYKGIVGEMLNTIVPPLAAKFKAKPAIVIVVEDQSAGAWEAMANKLGWAFISGEDEQGVAEGVTSPEIKQAYDAAMKTKPGTPERKRAVAHYQKLRADALAKKKPGLAEGDSVWQSDYSRRRQQERDIESGKEPWQTKHSLRRRRDRDVESGKVPPRPKQTNRVNKGVAEANKHSVIGKIQRGHELKKKVDQSYRDIGAAQQAGDKAAGSRAFRKHERLANLERPGTWTKPKDLSENSAPTEKVGSIIKRVLGKQLQWEPGISKLYKNTRRSRTQRVDDYAMKYISTGVKSPDRLSANSGDAVAVALKKQLIQSGYPVHDDVLIFPDQIMFQVRTPISVTAESAAGKQK